MASTPTRCSTPLALRRRAAAFLRRYEAGGRIVRWDQGGDSVSEGQAYGLIIAELAGEPAAFSRIWTWTERELARPDGLLSWRWSAGRVAGRASAADADVLAAWALLRSRGRGSASYHVAGRRLAKAVLAKETARLPGGQSVLVAGDWAVSPPVTVDPSYWALPAFAALARATSDPRWSRLATGAVSAMTGLTGNGRRLPPDWAEVRAESLQPVPAPPPATGGPPQYGPDAQRLVIWAAVGTGAGKTLAARWWRLLRPYQRSTARALSLDGTVIHGDAYPLAAFASAAAAGAAGDPAGQAALCRIGIRLAAAHPTYYGDAWTVLAPALLSGALR